MVVFVRRVLARLLVVCFSYVAYIAIKTAM